MSENNTVDQMDTEMDQLQPPQNPTPEVSSEPTENTAMREASSSSSTDSPRPVHDAESAAPIPDQSTTVAQPDTPSFVSLQVDEPDEKPDAGPFTMDESDEEQDTEMTAPPYQPPQDATEASGQRQGGSSAAPLEGETRDQSGDDASGAQPVNTSSAESAVQASTEQVIGSSSEPKPESQPAANTAAAPVNPLQNIDLQALLSKLSPSLAQQGSKPPTQPVQAASPSSTLPTPISATANVAPGTTNTVNSTNTSPILPPPSASLPPHPYKGHNASLPPPPHLANRKPHSEAPSANGDEEEDRPFTAAEEKAFDDFLQEEQDYVSKGQWDRFPVGSRLFIGNLPTEKVTKRDLFRIFSKHGRLAQISIKQAYGFIQFLDVKSCESALRSEEGTPVRGRRMHLEISKPQRNTHRDTRRTRSRSPDYKGPQSPRGRHGRDRDRERDSRGGSHYIPTDRGVARGRDNYRERDRDEYRRSSPPRRGRDDYRPHRDRSRSRTPPRYRSRSPIGDSFSLPGRTSKDIPEVQILVTDRLQDDFIWYVRKPFMQKNIKTDVCYLSPRLSAEEMVRKMVVEGVSAVIFLNSSSQQTGKVTLQVFDRRGGDNNVRFETYDNLDPSIACDVTIRVRSSHQPAPSQYGAQPQYAPQFSPTTPIAPPTPTMPTMQQNAIPPNLAELIRSMDPATLQTFLTTLQQAQPQPQAPQPPPMMYPQPTITPPPQSQQKMQADLASLLAARGALPVAQPPNQQQTSQQAYGSQQGYPANLANLLAQGNGGQVPNIFDALAHLKR